MPAPSVGSHHRPWQFSIRTLVLLPVYSVPLIGGLLLLLDSGSSARGIGFTNITIHFVVLDSTTRSPVSEAVVGLYDADQRSVTESAETSPLGKAKILRDVAFAFTGGSLLRRSKATVNFDALCFEVSAQGYKPARYWLAQFTGGLHDLNSSKPIPTAVVKLDRLETD
jgi:hypothetical protein